MKTFTYSKGSKKYSHIQTKVTTVAIQLRKPSDDIWTKRGTGYKSVTM